MKALSIILLFIALILETSILTLPLVLIVLLVTSVIYQEHFVFILAFISGFLLDILTFKTVGLSSLFFVVFIFLIYSYQKKFEIFTNYFIVLSSFLGSFLFLVIFSYSNVILQSVISSFLGLILFNLVQRVNTNTISNS